MNASIHNTYPGTANADVLVMPAGPPDLALGAALTAGLLEWTDSAMRRYPNGLVVMAGTSDIPEGARLAKLMEVRDFVVRCGFPSARVRYATEALPDGTSSSAFLLKIISAREAELEVQSICGLLKGAAESTGGAPCTSAS